MSRTRGSRIVPESFPTEHLAAAILGVLALSATVWLLRVWLVAPWHLVGGVGALWLGIGLAWWWLQTRHESRRWRRPIRRLARQLSRRDRQASAFDVDATAGSEIRVLVRALEQSRPIATGSDWATPAPALTRSGLYEPPSNASGEYQHVGIGTGEDPSSASHAGNDMVLRRDPDGFQGLDASPAAREFLGWSLDRLRSVSILDLIHPDDRPMVQEQLQIALNRGEAHGLICRIQTDDDHRKVIEVNVGVRYDTDGSIAHLRCHLTDITERVRVRKEQRKRTRELVRLNEELTQANRALAELKDRYSDLYQNAPAMYFSLDTKGRILVCNDTLLRTLGYRRRDLVGHSYAELLSEDQRPLFAKRFQQFLRDGVIEVESHWTRADGQRIDVLIKGTAVRDPSGRVVHSRSVAQDITPLKRLAAELQFQNQRLELANEELSRRNKELDEFSYVVSHDLQEPLRTLTAFSEFLRQDCGDKLDATGLEYLHYLTEASKRMRVLIHDLLDLSRAGKVIAEFRPVDLSGVLNVIQADFAELIRSKRATIQILEPLPTLWGDRDRIAQLFGNLISNALKYNDAENPRVEIGARPDDHRSWATLYVRDNGIGIDPQFHAKIFQIFRRLHAREQYEGTGAGLAICHKIVEAHGGRITVESQPGQGSTFVLTLPRSAQPAAVSTPDQIHVP